MKMLTLNEFEKKNLFAATLAIDIIDECGGDEDGTPDREEFVVWSMGKGVYVLEWRDYGPFNPVPRWAWDPKNTEWVPADGSDEDFARFEFLTHGGRE